MFYIRGLQTKAHGQNPARESISSSRRDILWITKKIIYLRKNCSFGTVHYNISRNIRNISGPRTVVQELMWPSDEKVWRYLFYINGSQTCLRRCPNTGSDYVLLPSIFCVVKRAQPVFLCLYCSYYFSVSLFNHCKIFSIRIQPWTTTA